MEKLTRGQKVSMILTDAERQRFAEYLERDAESSDLLAGQFEKMPGQVMADLAKKHRIEAAAAKIIARRLRATESMTVGGA